MFPIKLTFGNEVRRVQVASNDAKKFLLGFSTLVQTAYSVFPSLREYSDVVFQWCDDENDVICCSTDEELSEALRVISSENKSVFKFDIVVQQGGSPRAQPQSNASGSIHQGVSCDGCAVSPIVGIRYKCCVREDFDLCEQCESRNQQPHPMIKIYAPDQAPVAIFVALNESDAAEVRHRRHGHGPFPFGGSHHGPFPFGGPHHGPAFGGPHGPPHGHHGRPHHPHRQWCNGPEQRECGRRKWERRGWGQRGEQVAQAFAAAANKFAEVFQPPASVPEQPVDPTISAEEQQLLDSVLRQSMEDLDVAVPVVDSVASPIHESVVEKPVLVEFVPEPVAPPAPVVVVEDVQVEVEDLNEPASNTPSAVAVWSRVWSKELELLGEMGFTDAQALIPLLQEYLGVPVSLAPELNGIPPPESMQRLLATLLQRSL